MRDLLAPLREKEKKFIRPLLLITLDHFANNFNDAIYCLVYFLGAVSFSLTLFASLCFFFAVNLRALPDLQTSFGLLSLTAKKKSWHREELAKN